jgi:intracellular multiplication protein IcmE
MSNTDNFDTPDGQEPDLDNNVEFDDFEDNKDKSLGESWKKSPLFKFGLVALVAVIVIAMISIFSGESVEAPESYVGKGNTVKEAPGVNEVSSVMKQALEERNDQRVEEAEKQGISAIPTPITPPKALLEIPQDDSQSEDPLLRWQQMQTERARIQREQQLMEEQQTQVDPNRQAQFEAMVNAMNTQMSTILGEAKKTEVQNMMVFDVSQLKEGSGPNGQGGLTGPNGESLGAGASVPTKPPVTIVPAGKIEYAQMILEANSDIPGPVVALIASGQFSGGKLLGKFSSQEEYLVITFDTLVTKKGTSIPVNAYAIDPATSLTGVATDVDHRYLKRIILPAAAKFVEGLGEAYSETTETSSQNATTTTTTSTNLDTKQEFGKAVADAASTVGEVLSEEGKNTKPLVIVAAGTPLGILFMSPITDQALLQSRAGISPLQGRGQNNNNNNNGQQNQGQFQLQGQNGLFAQDYMNQLQQFQNSLQNQQNFQQNTNQNSNVGQ